MRFFSKLLVCFLCAVLNLGAAPADITLESEPNRQRIYIGESFILQVKINGTSEALEPDLSAIASSDIRRLDSREYSNYSITIINGKLTRQGEAGRVVSYEITPHQAGLFRAGPISLDVAGKQLTEVGSTVDVVDVTEQDEVRVILEASQKTVLAEEPFEICLRVQIQTLPGRFQEAEPLLPRNPPLLQAPFLNPAKIEGLKGPEISSLLEQYLARSSEQPGFFINDYTSRTDPFGFSGFFDMFRQSNRARFALPRRLTESDGKSYFEYHICLEYIPEQEGDYVFGPVTLKGNIPVAVSDDGRAVVKEVFAVGRSVTVRVIPPPAAGRPPSFTGALGSNMQAAAVLDRLECNDGDPVSLTITITGQVRFESMLPPKLETQTNLTESFVVYDQTVQTFADSAEKRRFVYTIRPRHAGVLEVPSLEIPYFDTAKREYVIQKTEPVSLLVRPREEVTAEQVVGASNAGNNLTAPVDDTALTPAMPWLAVSETDSLNAAAKWWLLALAGPVLYGLLLLGEYIQVRYKRYLIIRRRKSAWSKARRHLRLLLKAGEPSKTRSLCSVIRKFLATRFELASASMTPADMRKALARVTADHVLINDLIEIYQRYFEQEYIGESMVSDFDRQQFRDDVVRLQEILAKLR